MRRLLRHRLVIGLSAIVLVVTVGAVAWAAPGGGGGTGIGTVGPPRLTADEGERFLGGHWRRGALGRVPEEFEQRMQERRALREQRRDAFLELVREKMSAEDQAALDRLTAQAEQQRDALEQARQAVIATERQIHDLVDEYFPLDPPTGEAPTEGSVR